MSKKIQSWCLPALFLWLCFISPANAATSVRTAQHPTWLLLLHSWQGKPQITHEKFLLSEGQYSAESELSRTVDLYKTDPHRTFCRFPARLTFLSIQLGFDLPADRFTQCPELQKFLQHVPFSTLELVYASEVLSSASSMMGHIFLKASGENFKGNSVAHSLAYYTEITTLNPAKLIIDSTITGMPGFFSVRPFSHDLSQYRDHEQRNLWQFTLRTTEAKRMLMQLHIWELNQLELTYYFQSFNCATLTLEIIALLDPAVMDYRRQIVSPTDVVKAAIAQQLVEMTNVSAAEAWLHHALVDAMPAKVVKQLNQIRFEQNTFAQLQELNHPLAIPYLNIKLDQAVATGELTKNQAVQIASALPNIEGKALDLSAYKHPALTPQDSAVGIGWSHDMDGSELMLQFLPAGHQMQSDNRQYLTESELLIAKVNLALDLEQSKLRVKEVALYSVQALTPDTDLFPVWSGEIYLGFRPAYTADLHRWSTGELSVGGGKTTKFHKDVTSYMLAGAGLSSDLLNSRGFIYAKAGVIFNLASDMKLQTQFLINSGKSKGSSSYSELLVDLSWFPQQNQSIHLDIKKVQNSYFRTNSIGINVFQYF